MRTQSVAIGVICLAVAAAVFQFAPLPGIAGGAGAGIDTGPVSDQANDSEVAEGFNGSARTKGEGSLIGTIISGGQSIIQIASLAAVVPSLLLDLGLPWWFAEPVGWIATIIGGIGVVQFVTGREYL